MVFSILLGHTDIANKYDTNKESQSTFLEIEKERVRYVQKGKGKDIVLVHGTPGSLEDWNSIIDSLSQNFRVTAFDRLGHGFSTKNNYTYHIKDNAELLKRIIEKLDLKSPMIVGHSYGGSTAAYLAATHYNDSLIYIIIDSPLFEYEPSTVLKLLSIPLLGKGIGFVANYTIAENHIEKGVTEAFANQNQEQLIQLIDERKEMWLQPKVLHSKAKESVNYQGDLDKISNKYNSITADITIVTGTDEKKTMKLDCERFHKDVPKSNLIIINKTGHYIQFDQSERIFQIINSKMK